MSPQRELLEESLGGSSEKTPNGSLGDFWKRTSGRIPRGTNGGVSGENTRMKELLWDFLVGSFLRNPERDILERNLKGIPGGITIRNSWRNLHSPRQNSRISSQSEFPTESSWDSRWKFKRKLSVKFPVSQKELLTEPPEGSPGGISTGSC